MRSARSRSCSCARSRTLVPRRTRSIARISRPWTLALEPASASNHPVLVLRPPPELAAGIFKQIFSRAMESLNSPMTPSIPVVLRGEFDATVGGRMTQDAMLAAAVAAGVEAAPVPRCLVHRRISEPGGVRQVYLVFFDAPAIAQFRRQLGLDAEALSPVLFVAGAGSDFNSWLPQRVNAGADCRRAGRDRPVNDLYDIPVTDDRWCRHHAGTVPRQAAADRECRQPLRLYAAVQGPRGAVSEIQGPGTRRAGFPVQPVWTPGTGRRKARFASSATSNTQ